MIEITYACDRSVVFLLPLLGALHERLPAKIVARLALSPPEHVLDDALCRYACVIATGDVRRCEAAHAVPSDEDVL